jgi:hypothetical protein
MQEHMQFWTELRALKEGVGRDALVIKRVDEAESQGRAILNEAVDQIQEEKRRRDLHHASMQRQLVAIKEDAEELVRCSRK